MARTGSLMLVSAIIIAISICFSAPAMAAEPLTMDFGAQKISEKNVEILGGHSGMNLFSPNGDGMADKIIVKLKKFSCTMYRESKSLVTPGDILIELKNKDTGATPISVRFRGDWTVADDDTFGKRYETNKDVTVDLRDANGNVIPDGDYDIKIACDKAQYNSPGAYPRTGTASYPLTWIGVSYTYSIYSSKGLSQALSTLKDSEKGSAAGKLSENCRGTDRTCKADTIAYYYCKKSDILIAKTADDGSCKTGPWGYAFGCPSPDYGDAGACYSDVMDKVAYPSVLNPAPIFPYDVVPEKLNSGMIKIYGGYDGTNMFSPNGKEANSLSMLIDGFECTKFNILKDGTWQTVNVDNPIIKIKNAVTDAVVLTPDVPVDYASGKARTTFKISKSDAIKKFGLNQELETLYKTKNLAVNIPLKSLAEGKYKIEVSCGNSPYSYGSDPTSVDIYVSNNFYRATSTLGADQRGMAAGKTSENCIQPDRWTEKCKADPVADYYCKKGDQLIENTAGDGSCTYNNGGLTSWNYCDKDYGHAGICYTKKISIESTTAVASSVTDLAVSNVGARSATFSFYISGQAESAAVRCGSNNQAPTCSVPKSSLATKGMKTCTVNGLYPGGDYTDHILPMTCWLEVKPYPGAITDDRNIIIKNMPSFYTTGAVAGKVTDVTSSSARFNLEIYNQKLDKPPYVECKDTDDNAFTCDAITTNVGKTYCDIEELEYSHTYDCNLYFYLPGESEPTRGGGSHGAWPEYEFTTLSDKGVDTCTILTVANTITPTVAASDTEATVKWDTSMNVDYKSGDSAVLYKECGSAADPLLAEVIGTPSFSHSITLTDLKPSTAYCFKVQSGYGGITCSSGDNTFTTAAESMANLQITLVDMPSSISAGETRTARVTVINAGTKEATGAYVSYKVGTATKESYIGTIAPGKSITWPFSGLTQAVAGKYNYDFSVRTDVTESSLDDNKITKTVSVGESLPDLAVTNGDLVISKTEGLNKGDMVYIGLKVSNIAPAGKGGVNDAKNAVVKFYYKIGSGQYAIFNTQTINVVAGSYAVASVDWPVADVGDITIEARVNEGKAIAEIDSMNNIATQMIHSSVQFDMKASDLTLMDTTVNVNGVEKPAKKITVGFTEKILSSGVSSATVPDYGIGFYYIYGKPSSPSGGFLWNLPTIGRFIINMFAVSSLPGGTGSGSGIIPPITAVAWNNLKTSTVSSHVLNGERTLYTSYTWVLPDTKGEYTVRVSVDTLRALNEPSSTRADNDKTVTFTIQ